MSATADTMTDPEGWQGFVSQFFDLPVHYNSSSKAEKKKKAPVIVHTESANPKIVAAADDTKKKKNETNKLVAAPAPAAAVAGRFTTQYGDNFTGLEPWVKLCRDLGVQGPLNSKTQCKKVCHRRNSLSLTSFFSLTNTSPFQNRP